MSDNTRTYLLTMFAPVLLPMCVMLAEYVDAASFDQSQSGNLNVQVDLKDLHIIALMKGGKEEYVDYDYAYDYNEMTIKPQNSTTPRPMNATNMINSTGSEPNATESATIGEISDITTSLLNTTHTESESSTIPVSTAETTGNKTASDFDNVSSTESIANATVNNGCKKGFAVNQKGDCVLKLQNVGTNALLKLVKLSQKLKLRREKRTTASRK